MNCDIIAILYSKHKSFYWYSWHRRDRWWKMFSNEYYHSRWLMITPFLFYKNSFCKNYEAENRPKIKNFARITPGSRPRVYKNQWGSNPTHHKNHPYCGGVLLLGRGIVRISIPLFINRGFHFTRISHICLLFSKWNTQPGHVLSGAELQHHHIITSKLFSQWNKGFPSLLFTWNMKFSSWLHQPCYCGKNGLVRNHWHWIWKKW